MPSVACPNTQPIIWVSKIVGVCKSGLSPMSSFWTRRDVWNRCMWRETPLNHLMIEEALRAPAIMQAHLQASHNEIKDSMRAIRDRQPSQLVTIARGSSDHA